MRIGPLNRRKVWEAGLGIEGGIYSHSKRQRDGPPSIIISSHVTHERRRVRDSLTHCPTRLGQKRENLIHHDLQQFRDLTRHEIRTRRKRLRLRKLPSMVLTHRRASSR